MKQKISVGRDPYSMYSLQFCISMFTVLYLHVHNLSSFIIYVHLSFGTEYWHLLATFFFLISDRKKNYQMWICAYSYAMI